MRKNLMATTTLGLILFCNLAAAATPRTDVVSFSKNAATQVVGHTACGVSLGFNFPYYGDNRNSQARLFCDGKELIS